jgi:hypothetical protein
MSNFVQVGFNNMLSVNQIETIAIPDSAPIKRSINEHKNADRLTDLTCGRKVKSVIFLVSGSIVLSALAPDTIIGRISSQSSEK